MKRFFDMVVSLCGIILFFPIFVLVAFLIKLDSPGPVFYRGVRSGRFGKLFYIYKFRTMKPGMEKSGGDTTALCDPRITNVGRFLRKYKIDELPQLINVLKGEMSLVGPRPELPVYTKRYTAEERCILDVKPGITDFSSIEFCSLDERVGQVDADKVFEETILPRKNELRVKYVKTQSFLTDVLIIFKTFVAIFKKAK